MACLQPTKSKSFKITKCIICQKSTKGATSSCTEHSVSKINKCANNRCRYGDIEYSSLQNLLQDLPVEELLKQKAIYHRDCYQNLTSTVKTERAKKRFAQATTSKFVLPKKKGRPSTATSSESATCGRLSRESYDRDKCILCQESSSVDLHEVTSENMGKQMREIAEKTKDESVRVRLSNLVASSDPLAAVAYDVKYHLPCLIKQKRQLEKDTGFAIQDRFGNILSDLEIVDAVSQDLQDERCVVLNMNDINTTYANILRENGCTANDPPRYKKYLKQLILENIPDVHFNKALQKSKSEQVLSTKTKETAVAMAIECSHTKEDIQVLMKAAQILRKEISDSPKWMFEGSFDNYTPPVMLYTFCRQLIQGRKTIQTERKDAAMDTHSSILAQHIVQAFKSDRQVSYCTKNEATTFQSSAETPLSVGLALDIHKLTRSKRLVEKLHALDLSISYPKLMQIETGLARAVQKQSEINDGICIPSVLMKDEFMWFAIDNIDFLEATPSGMNTLHGTALAAFQSKIEGGEPITGQMVIDRTTAEGALPEALSCKLSSCAAPVPSKHIIACELRENSIAPNLEYSNQTDLLWAIGCNQRSSDNGTKAPGTWSAFNSLISSIQTCTNVSLCAPLLRLPPTNYDALFTVLMRAQGITTQIMGPNKMCVVTVDLQLYDMVMKLWVEREDIREQFIFRPGELHTVFWSLTALGKYIEGSGVDQAWIEAGLYSPTTVSKILTGKNMYRALDAHTVTLLALYQLYLDQLAIKNPDIGNSLKEIARSLGEAYENDTNRSPQDIRSSLLEAVSDPVQRESVKQIQDRLSEYEGSPNKMQKFVMSYLKQFQTILLFVRATRQNDFRLHLAATESLLKYFFAHDHQNYARLLSLYLASMQQTEQHHPEIWQEFMNGKFGISSGPVPFTTRSPDHGIEHENRKLKVIGGIVGLTQNDIALDRFFMIAPEMSRLCDEFENRYNVSMDSIRTKHHEIWGSKLQTTLLNAEKMKDVLASHGNPFDESETELHTLLTNKVMTEKEANDILNRDTIGQQCFETFVHQRLNEGEICVWDRMSKVKLKTFKSSNVSKAISVGDKVIKVKEESSLLHRFIIAGRSRPELDLKECIGGYEFGIIPRSLFASDGTLLLPYDKAKVLHQLEVIGSEDTGETSHGDINSSNASPSDPATLRLIIIDGMAMVHTMKKTSTMLTCKDFAVAFTCKLIETVKPYDEVRLVFDRYLEHSMKEKMRMKRTGGNTTYYHIKDNTLIRNISLSSFLAHNKTKAELTEYLAEKTLHEAVSSNSLKKFMVTAGTTTRGNIDIPTVLQTHSQEEADTIMILHASTIDKDVEVVVYSPDTDVLLLLIQLHKHLPSDISLLTGKGKASRKIQINPICEKLGENRAEAILPWHVFTGSDVTGRFAGKTKDWCFKVFLDCDELILKALSSLCHTDEQPTEVTVSELERFVCLIYKSQVHSNVSALRWSMYAHKQALAEQLPPTKGSLIPMIQRAHYVTRLLMKSTESHPVLPSPTDHGWLMQPDGTLIPTMCNDPPAPEAILKLIKCGCKKGCKSAYCSCLGKKMCCTELCGCADFECNNVPLERPTDFDSETE